MRAVRFGIAGFTIIEVLTALGVVAVLAAVAIPMWKTHLLHVRRADAATALMTVQTAQDSFFGKNARYADGAQLIAAAPAGLGLRETSDHGYYSIDIRSGADGLEYLATARVKPLAGQDADTRCVQLSVDQNGMRRASDSAGVDRNADCWR
jgi:type IV pilus assembly protein PilE